MAELGKGYVQIVPSAEGIEGSITEILNPEAQAAGKASGNTIGRQIGSFATKAVAAIGVGKAISNSISSGMDFQESMTKASTLFSGTSDELAALQSQILDISSSTGVAAAQLAEAAYSAESASVPVGNLGDMIEASAQLATAGFTDIDTALSATAKTMNAYGMMSDDVVATQEAMEKVQRILIQTQNKGITTVGELGASLAQVTPTAAAFGVNFENVGAALAGMTAQGTSTAQATTQLNSLIAELGKEGTTAATNLTAAAEGTEYAGMSFSEMMDAGANLNDILTLMSGLAEENNLSMVDMFSSIEAGKAALSISGSDFTGNLTAMATDADLVGEAYATMSDTVSFKAEQFKTSLKNMGIEAFNASAGILTGIVDGLSKVFQAIAPYVKEFAGALLELGDAVLEQIGNLLGLDEGFSATDVIIQVLTDVFSTLTAAVQFLTDHTELLIPIVAALTAAFIAINGPIGAVVAIIGAAIAIGTALYTHWDEIKSKIIEIWETIKSKASEVWNGVKTAVMTPINTVRQWLSSAWQTIRQTATTVWEGIKSAITSPIESAKNIISGIIETIKGFFSFNISWPHIPMPHFAIEPEGWKIGDLLKGSIPHLGIDWYAKGGIFDGPAVVGVGEAGREAAIPLEGQYMRPFAAAIADQMGGRNVSMTFNVYDVNDPETFTKYVMQQLNLEMRIA